MLNLIAALALLPLAFAQAGARDYVRLGLFSLLKPEAISVRLARGEGAAIDGAGLRGGQLARGESLRAVASGNQIKLAVLDSYGRVKRTAVTPRVRIAPLGGASFELNVGGKLKREVRGEVEISAREAARGQLQVVLTTSRTSAVASVVAAEMRTLRAPEALKALAVVARTFMLSHEGRHDAEGFDFCDTTHCQLYRGESDLAAEAHWPLAASAAAATEGQFLSFAGRPIEGYYTAVCGGATITPHMAWGGATSSNYPYKRVACRWCRASRYSRWERSAEAHKVLGALSEAAGFSLSPSAEIAIVRDEAEGPVRAVTVRDKGREASLATEEFRRAIGRALGWSTVLSPTFTIERRGPSYLFRGRGFGSQVGLCMVGAAAQAQAGRDYREILNFYYPQSDLAGREGAIEGR